VCQASGEMSFKIPKERTNLHARPPYKNWKKEEGEFRTGKGKARGLEDRRTQGGKKKKKPRKGAREKEQGATQAEMVALIRGIAGEKAALP